MVKKVNRFGCGCGFKTSYPKMAVIHFDGTGHLPAYGRKELREELRKMEKKEA